MLRLGKTTSQMHCLYCDQPLALLKRLTGDGEFCSKEHRKLYQRKNNKLALERLLASQPAPRPGKSRPSGQSEPPIETIYYVTAP